MKTWKEFTEMQMVNRPGGVIQDRSLESFPTVLQDLQLAAKGIMNPAAKQEINNAIVKFQTELGPILRKYWPPQRNMPDNRWRF